jgi:hypothetical protein
VSQLPIKPKGVENVATESINIGGCSKFLELLQYFHINKKGVFINGFGVGKIVKIQDDFIDFEIVHEDEKKLYRETMLIPINAITTISNGEQAIPKSELDTKIDNDLGDIL